MGSSPEIDRRFFLKAALPFALGFGTIIRGQDSNGFRQFGEADVPRAREELLTVVNAERALASLNQLKIDELACRVATAHAWDMIKRDFLSHWGSDGRKPYHRYSFAGGTDAVQENVSLAEHILSPLTTQVLKDLYDMHKSMLNERPPNDGHRLTILDPHHTHVGFGIAYNGRRLRLDELYLARYLHLDPIQRNPRSVTINGRLLNSNHFLHEVDIFYEPPPTQPDLSWLQTPHFVALPSLYVPLRPRAPSGAAYADGTKGDYEWNRDGKFSVTAKFFKNEPGIYTIVFWVRRVPSDKAFPGGEVCVLVES
jgi:uncharacterized protein YkwD